MGAERCNSIKTCKSFAGIQVVPQSNGKYIDLVSFDSLSIVKIQDDIHRKKQLT